MIFGFSKERRRERLRAQPIPAAWEPILARNVRIFRQLPPQDQNELLGHMQVFLAEKNFEGCGGLELTEEIRVTIAAQACLLLLHRKTDYYPQLISILVYPSGYTVPGDRYVGGDLWEEGGEDMLGHTERHMRSLVLAWDAVKQGGLDPSDGQNLVLHEFAHQLDFEDPGTDGAPALSTRSEYLAWASVMKKEFEALRAAAEADLPTVLDIYGATNPAEFFAIVTEAFFERPRVLRERHPDLYAALGQFFLQDPARDFSE